MFSFLNLPILDVLMLAAYNNYRFDAKQGVVQTSTNVVSSALNTCLALKGVSDCSTESNIQVKTNPDITITAVTGTGTVCFNIVGASTGSVKDANAVGCADDTGTKCFHKEPKGTALDATAGKCHTNGSCQDPSGKCS